MDQETIGTCWNCGAEMTAAHYGRENNCPSCSKPTRVCRNCRWYAPGRPNACEEPMADEVKEKERANFCEYFEPTRLEAQDGKSSEDDLLKAAEELFKF